MQDTVVAHEGGRRQGAGLEKGEPRTRWLLLIHHLPPEPAYFRVRVRRRLAAIGAVAVKNSVYALPDGDETREDFVWLRGEIVEEGGEAHLCEATFLDDESERQIRDAFVEDRNADYEELARKVEGLKADLEAGATVGPERIAGLRTDLAGIRARDYFDAPARERAEQAIALLELEARPAGEDDMRGQDVEALVRGRTWVTRKGPKVDRMASAWLIRRFIDPEARFEFVAPEGYEPDEGELRFDMFEGEFTHEGGGCTFETLLARFGLADDPSLVAIGEIVHDLDLKDERYGRPETAGVGALLEGIALDEPEDEARLERGRVVFESLYARLSGGDGS